MRGAPGLAGVLVSALLCAGFSAAGPHPEAAAAPVTEEDALAAARGLMRKLADGVDDAQTLREMRALHEQTCDQPTEVKRYIGRFLRKDPELQLAATCALLGARVEISEDELSRLSQHDHPALRETAIWYLGVSRMQSEACSRALISALGDPDAEVRKTAAWAVGARMAEEHAFWLDFIPGPWTPEASLSGVIGIGSGNWHPSDLVRDLGQPIEHWARWRAWDCAANWLDDGQSLLRAVSSDAELRPEVRAALPGLLALVDDEDEQVALSALWALEPVAPSLSRAAPRLMELSLERNGMVAYGALVVLVSMGPSAAAVIPDLQRELSGEDPVNGLLNVLWNAGDTSCAEFALAGLAATDRNRVAESLGVLSVIDPLPEEALPALEKSFLGGNYAAAAVLLRFGERALPALRRGLDHPLDDAKGVSLFALAKLGPAAAEALPRVRELAQSSEKTLAKAAVRTVEALER